MRRRYSNRVAVPLALSATSLVFGLPATPAKAQVTSFYFDTNGSTAGFGTLTGTFDWDATTNGGLWNSSSAGTNATIGWTQAQFPRFNPTGTPTYTVTVSREIQLAGVFFQAAQNITINALNGGSLNMVPGNTGTQGIIGFTGVNAVINAPITGAATINPNNGGQISLFGINTYTGGTSLTSNTSLIHFNNSSSFSTGTITNNQTVATGFAPLLAAGGATVTLPNNFSQIGPAGSGINFAADANTPVVSTGTWNLGTNLSLRNNGNSTSPLTLTNTISGGANLALSGANGGTIIFSGANTYTGSTTIGVTGATSITLRLGAANTIASTSSLILAGGTLNPGGFNHNMIATTLGLTANSSINFSAGASELDFADSTGLNWNSFVLNLVGWNPAVDRLRFGNSASGLTPAQLARIQFNGAGLGTAGLDANGFVVVVASAAPEPGTFGLLGMGLGVAAPGAFFSLRRRCSGKGSKRIA